jgi:hypothetical protein
MASGVPEIRTSRGPLNRFNPRAGSHRLQKQLLLTQTWARNVGQRLPGESQFHTDRDF